MQTEAGNCLPVRLEKISAAVSYTVTEQQQDFRLMGLCVCVCAYVRVCACACNTRPKCLYRTTGYHILCAEI